METNIKVSHTETFRCACFQRGCWGSEALLYCPMQKKDFLVTICVLLFGHSTAVTYIKVSHRETFRCACFQRGCWGSEALLYCPMQKKDFLVTIYVFCFLVIVQLQHWQILKFSHRETFRCGCFQIGCWGSGAAGHRCTAHISAVGSAGRMTTYSSPGRSCSTQRKEMKQIYIYIYIYIHKTELFRKDMVGNESHIHSFCCTLIAGFHFVENMA